MAAHDSAGASASTLAETGRTRPLGQAVFGPCLYVDMGEPALIAALNAWGSARDRELEALRADLVTTKAVVEMTFDQAQAGVSATLLAIIEAFRAEAANMQQHAGYEAQQSLARLTQVVAEARARFDAQDGRFTEGLSELVRRQQAVETWARAEPTRVAAVVQAAPASPWVPTSPGGTPLTFYPSPGLPAAPTTPPPRAAVAPVWAPVWDASPSPQAPGATPAWDAWAAGRGAAPAPDAWAAGRAAAPRPFDDAPPPGFGGGGGLGDVACSAYTARHVRGRHFNQETRDQDACR